MNNGSRPTHYQKDFQMKRFSDSEYLDVRISKHLFIIHYSTGNRPTHYSLLIIHYSNGNRPTHYSLLIIHYSNGNRPLITHY